MFFLSMYRLLHLGTKPCCPISNLPTCIAHSLLFFPFFPSSVPLADLSVSGRRSGAPCWSEMNWALSCEVLFASCLNSGPLWVIVWLCRATLFFTEELEFSFSVAQSDTDVLSAQGCSLYGLLFRLFAMGCVSLVTLVESPSIRLNLEPGGVGVHCITLLLII